MERKTNQNHNVRDRSYAVRCCVAEQGNCHLKMGGGREQTAKVRLKWLKS